MLDMWQKKVENVKTEEVKIFFLSYPHVFSNEGWEWVRAELENFKAEIIQKYKVKIDENELINSLKIYQQNEELMKKINEMRTLDIPYLSGTEFFKIAIANSAVRKEYANIQLNQIIEELNTKKDQERPKVRARLLLIGSSVDNPDFISILEHAGAVVVSDAVCTGVRSFIDDQMWRPDNISLNTALDTITQKVYTRVFCPRMMNAHKNRFEFIKEQIKRAKIDGVILQRIEFCDLHGCENSLYEHTLQEQLNIPVISLDREYFLGDTGRLRTRVEAFLEKIGDH
jgi:benzoyl-CoA reductase/2-hydroxyglutaryl-CoA dehydratase subunit BcrC/BadD/HgdB